MLRPAKYWNNLPISRRYKIKWVMLVVTCWTLIDLSMFSRHLFDVRSIHNPFYQNLPGAYLLRILFTLITAMVMASILLFNLYSWKWVTVKKLVYSWLIKSLLLSFIVLVFSIILFYLHYHLILGMKFEPITALLRHYSFETRWLPDQFIKWGIFIFGTQVLFEVDQKYSPGIFWSIIIGEYKIPRNVERVIMFIDLKDSTIISEQLGHEKYFLFIRDFIMHVSNAGLKCDGSIYQYVGDEVIFTWPVSEENNLKCINAILGARKNIQADSVRFNQEFGIVPEFRAGIHSGFVTIGEIGIVKKDIAISGEAMNITARIKTACTELGKNYIVSESYFTSSALKEWQGEDLGEISLKGVTKGPIKLYALKI